MNIKSISIYLRQIIYFYYYFFSCCHVIPVLCLTYCTDLLWLLGNQTKCDLIHQGGLYVSTDLLFAILPCLGIPGSSLSVSTVESWLAGHISEASSTLSSSSFLNSTQMPNTLGWSQEGGLGSGFSSFTLITRQCVQHIIYTYNKMIMLFFNHRVKLNYSQCSWCPDGLVSISIAARRTSMPGISVGPSSSETHQPCLKQVHILLRSAKTLKGTGQ